MSIFVAPVKKIMVMANSIPWLDNDITLALHRQKNPQQLKTSGLETDQDKFRTYRTHPQKMMLKTKKSYPERVNFKLTKRNLELAFKSKKSFQQLNIAGHNFL